MPRLPKAVEKQAQLADEFHQKAYGNTEDGTPAQPAPTAAPEELKQNDPPFQTEPATDAPAESQPAPTAFPKENEQPKQKFPDADPQSEVWEHKYKVLANKYSAEIPRFAAEIRQLKEELGDVKAENAKLKAAPAAQPMNLDIKPEEVEEYGENFINLVKRAAASAAQNASPGDVGEIRKEVDRLKRDQQQMSQQKFFDELVKQAPQWERLNTNSEFLEWLSGLDPLTGRSRQDLFDDAYSRLDAWRVANFFNGFGSENKEPPPLPSAKLAEQVTPKTSRATPAQPASNKKIWSHSDIARFYSDVRNGKIDQEAGARIESEIFAAQNEGRIR
jgi:hypothetical protein